MEPQETFDTVAPLYDAVRPSYPATLVEEIVSHTALPPAAEILEIGVGTGQATLLLAERGYAITGLEPGRNLAALAARNLSAYPWVRMETTSFEAWPLRAGGFDLVLSAQAFHWVAPETGYVKAAQALKPGGHLALFWNMPPDDDPVAREMDAVYDRVAPEMGAGAPRRTLGGRIARIGADIRRSGLFWDVAVRRFPWAERYDADRYLDLLGTYSDHLALTPETRAALFAGIRAVIVGYGGAIRKPYTAVLFLARKK